MKRSTNHTRRRASDDRRADDATIDGSILGRVSPHSREAEQAVLGAMMLDRNAVAAVVDTIDRADAFYVESHRAIYEAMLSLRARRQPIDLITLHDELRQSGRLADVGGSVYLSELGMKTPTSANAAHHARIVQDRAMSRRQIELHTTAVGTLYDGADPYETMEATSRALFDLRRGFDTSGPRSLHALALEAAERLELVASARADGRLLGMPSTIGGLNRLLGGFQRTALVIVGARPAMGKSGYMTTEMLYGAEQGCPQLAFSAEMAALQVAARMMYAKGSVDSHKAIQGDLSDDDWSRIIEAIGSFEGLPVMIDGRAAPSLDYIRSTARRWLESLTKEQRERACIWVDYLTLMGTAPGSRKRTEEVGANSRGLKQLAKELDVPIIVLAQLNRSVEGRTDKRPTLSDLRDSGEIEQDGDVVMFLHRPEYYGEKFLEDGAPTEGVAEIIVAKHRAGPTGVVTARYNAPFIRFEESLDIHQIAHSLDSRADTYVTIGARASPHANHSPRGVPKGGVPPPNRYESAHDDDYPF
jgi:replicative DNA helicase